MLKDLRFAWRLLRRSPGFSAVVLLTLAVGIGANTVMFSVVNTVLLRPLPYGEADRLVSVQPVDPARRPAFTAPPDYYAYRERTQTLDRIEAFYGAPYNLTGGGDPERVPTLIVSSGFFDTLGVTFAAGRGFRLHEEQQGSHRVAVLSHALWQRRFSADPAIVGTPITLNGEPFIVVGVLPAGFYYLGVNPQIFVPMSFRPGDALNSHSNHFLRLFGRTRAGVTHTQAAAELSAVAGAIDVEQSLNPGTTVEVMSLRDALVGGDVRRALLVLLGAVGLVLLIACANLANLLLARAAVRQREIAVRLAIGASRARLVGQFLVEGLLLSLGGGALGLVLAYATADMLNAISPLVLPRAADIKVDPAVLAFTFIVAVTTGVLLGLAPAIHSVGADLGTGLKEGMRTTPDAGGRYRLRHTLIVVEVALSLVLLVGAGLLLKSMYRILHVPAGFEPDGVLTLQINLPARKYIDARQELQLSNDAYDRVAAFFSATVERVRALPGVTAVGAVNVLPLGGDVWSKNLTLYDRPLPRDVSGLPSFQYRVVAGDYFRALGIPILSGRPFTDADGPRAPKVAIVSQELVRRHYPGQSPIGKVVSVNPPLEVLPRAIIEEARRAGALPDGYEPDKFTIVGVAADVRYGGLEKAALPVVYVPYAQGSEGTTNMFLAVRTPGDPLALVPGVRAQVMSIDREQPIAAVQTMSDRVAASVAQRRLQTNVLSVFGAIAALLAAIGIYGVTSFTVTQRTREIGIRLALGAAKRDVTSLMLRQSGSMVALGLGAGLVIALPLTRLLRTLLFDVSATDAGVFAGIVAMLAITAGVATYLPARRAARLDPLLALRRE